MQGESEANNGATKKIYSEKLNDFFNRLDLLLTQSGLNLNYQKIIGVISDIYPQSSEVRSAQLNFCQEKSNQAICVDTKDYPFHDDIHFSEEGQSQFAQDIFKVLK